jgi:uncharacterized protein
MTRIRRTLEANQHLVDPVRGGVFQYSDEVNWKSPHYEKLMSYQADDLRIYSEDRPHPYNGGRAQGRPGCP